MDEWDRLFSVNVRAVMMACKLFGAHMIEQGGGKIINLSSVRDDRGALGGNAGYCATKGAVKMITKQLGVELAPYKVYVNALGPIITVTPMTAERIKQDASRYERMLMNVPMGRMADVGDLVGPAVFLASPASDFITGTVLYVDGGMMAYA
jgi:gluconate 5-dehydrogenase